MTRNRAISNIIGNKPRNQPKKSTQKKRDKKVACYCNKCNGKLVLKRTKLFHDSESTLTESAKSQRDEGLSNLDKLLSQIQRDTELPTFSEVPTLTERQAYLSLYLESV